MTMDVKPQVAVEPLEANDPTFEAGSVHTAVARLTNPTTKEFTYVTELYLGVLKVVTSGIGTVTIPAGGFSDMQYTIIAPIAEGVYEVYLDVSVGGVLVAHYKATENVTIEVSPAIELGPITWV